MRASFIWKMALVAGCVGLSTPAFAEYPKDWDKVETTAYTMGLPAHWTEFRENLFEPDKDPRLGAWYYMGPTAQSKVFVRVRPLKPGSMKDAVTRSLGELARKVSEMKTLQAPTYFPPDEKKREIALLILKGVSVALGKKTKTEAEYEHFIARVIVHDPEAKLQVVMTYLFGPESATDPQAFAEQHLPTFKLNTPKRAKEVYALHQKAKTQAPK
jgi:hypothetical protein